MSVRLLLSFSVPLICVVAAGSEPSTKGSPKLQTTPLKAVSTVPASKGGFLAWIEPVKSDDKGNAYFLVLPALRSQTDPAAEVPKPRDVLRISGDGKGRSTLSPIKSSKLATATTVTTAGIALDPDGLLSMLVWARWRDANGGEDERGQYILSVDKDGNPQAQVEVDWRELGVTQFEAFGAGKFLLRGRWSNGEEMRLAILSPTGTLQDVDWSELPSEPSEQSTPGRTSFGQMVRGGDGRIYITRPGKRPDETVVYAISASGQSERMYSLRAMPGGLPLVGMKAAGDRLAAVYVEHIGEKQRWWIAVYGNLAGGLVSPLAVYGPAPAAPISYRLDDAGDRFTFLKGGNFITMSSP